MVATNAEGDREGGEPEGYSLVVAMATINASNRPRVGLGESGGPLEDEESLSTGQEGLATSNI